VIDVSLSLPPISRAAVVGVFGGAGLVLTTIYSRRGPLIYPVYAALLSALALLLARYRSLAFSTRFAAAFTGVLVATCMLFVAVLVLGGRQRRALQESGRPTVPGHIPAWGPPLLGVILVAISGGVAFVSS